MTLPQFLSGAAPVYDDPPPLLDSRPLPLVFRLAAAAFVILALFALAGLVMEVW